MRVQFLVAPAYVPSPAPGYYGDYGAPARYLRVLGRGRVPQADTSVAGPKNAPPSILMSGVGCLHNALKSHDQPSSRVPRHTRSRAKGLGLFTQGIPGEQRSAFSRTD